jgi:hypothetical protein
MLADGGVTSTEATGMGVTVMAAVPLLPSLVAVMVAGPPAIAVASPVGLTVAIAGAATYGIVLASRLHRPPIELPRLSATLPLSVSLLARAKLAWLLGWWVVFAGAPALFAALRQTDPSIGLALTLGATIVMIVAGALPR